MMPKQVIRKVSNNSSYIWFQLSNSLNICNSTLNNCTVSQEVKTCLDVLDAKITVLNYLIRPNLKSCALSSVLVACGIRSHSLKLKPAFCTIFPKHQCNCQRFTSINSKSDPNQQSSQMCHGGVAQTAWLYDYTDRRFRNCTYLWCPSELCEYR